MFSLNHLTKLSLTYICKELPAVKFHTVRCLASENCWEVMMLQ